VMPWTRRFAVELLNARVQYLYSLLHASTDLWTEPGPIRSRTKLIRQLLPFRRRAIQLLAQDGTLRTQPSELLARNRWRYLTQPGRRRRRCGC
jgi:hypothetical protein